MRWMFKALIGVCLFSTGLQASLVHAGVAVGGTRLVYEASKKQASLSVINSADDIDYLIQSWLDPYADTDKEPVPFVITPPLFRLDAKQEGLLRVVYTGAELPADRESVFWLSVKAIAAVEQSEENRLQIAIRSRLKMFYRPTGLAGLAEDAHKALIFSREGKQLWVDNPTPYFVSLQSVTLGDSPIPEPGMVPPMGRLELTIPQGATGQVTWQAINDYGGITAAISQ